MDTPSLLVLHEVSKRYGRRAVLTNVDMSMRRGETAILRGSNGSGKSTLLKIIAGFEDPTSGGRTLHGTKLVIGYTPDHLPKLNMTSTEYLTHMGRIAGIPAVGLKVRIQELHELYGLEEKAVPMTYYSKGMLQKVNLMQATLRKPDLLVLDEPLSGLDTESIGHVMTALAHWMEQGTAIVAAVHESRLARQLRGRTYWLRQGRLSQEDDVESLYQEAYYELDCELPSEAHQSLMAHFADVDWTQRQVGYRYRLPAAVHRDFLVRLLQQDGTIRSLMRKEE